MTPIPAPPCIFCHHEETNFFFDHQQQQYFQCPQCQLIFVPAQFHLDQQAEKAIYDLHENDPKDSRYRQFLNRIALPLHNHLPPQSYGLDFGCGPGPTLSIMLNELGHRVELFDPYYYPNYDTLKNEYDFISLTEVVEHLSNPYDVLVNLLKLIKSNGTLAIMTKLASHHQDFKSWGYKNDPTHITLFKQETFLWFAEQHQLHLEFIDRDILFLRKN